MFLSVLRFRFQMDKAFYTTYNFVFELFELFRWNWKPVDVLHMFSSAERFRCHMEKAFYTTYNFVFESCSHIQSRDCQILLLQKNSRNCHSVW